MGLFDKIGDFAEKVTDSASKMAEEKGVFDKMDNIKEKASDNMDNIKEKTSEAMGNMTSSVKDYRAEAAEAKKPLEGCIQWYNVVYKGGLANIDPKKTYIVATIDYLANGGDYMAPMTRCKRLFVDTQKYGNHILNYVKQLQAQGKKIDAKENVRIKKK